MHPDEFYEIECCECKEKEKVLDDVKYWFKAVIDTLYHDDDSLEELERYLEELAFCIGMNVPGGDLQIIRKNRTLQSVHTSEILQAWKNVNNNYLKSFIHKGEKHASI
jgi:hypothetical protein